MVTKPRRWWWKWAFLSAIGLAAAAMAVALRLHDSLSVDEPFMANSVRLGWRALFDVFRGDNIPLPYAILKAWTAVFGESEWALRAPFVLAYVGAVLCTGAAGFRVAGTTAGLAAATFVATSQRIGLLHAATARPYAWLAFFAALAMWQSLALLDRADATRHGCLRPAALLLTHLLGLFTHPTYIFVLAAYACASSVAAARLWNRATLAAGGAALLYVLLWGRVVAATMNLNVTDWMAAPRLADLKWAALWLWGTGPAFLLAGALIVLALASRRRTAAVFASRWSRWCACACLLGWAVPFLVSYARPVFLAARTPVMLLPVTAMLAAGVLSALASRAAVTAVAVLFLAAAASGVRAGAAADAVGTRASVDAVLERASPSDTFVTTQLAFDPVVYYLRRLGAPAVLQPVAFPAALGDWDRRSGPPDTPASLEKKGEALAAALGARGHRVWVFGRTRGLTSDATEVLLGQLRLRFLCEPPLPLRGAGFDAVWRCSPGFTK